MLDHILAWLKKDLREARRIWDSGLAQIQEFVFSDFARLHIRYKTGTWIRGFISNPFMRSPLPKPLKSEVKEFVKLYSMAGLSVIENDELIKVMNSLPR